MGITGLLVLAAESVSPKQLLRLDLPVGQKYAVTLEVDRTNPKTSGTIRHTVTVTKRELGAVTLEDSLDGMILDGRDRSADLRRLLKRGSVTFSWTPRAQRTGGMSSLEFASQSADLMPLLSETGLYLCEFPARAVHPGDTWHGSTTATGGCTSATYTLKALRTEGNQAFAIIEVTDIQFMIPVDLLDPLVMTVDVKSGIPVRAEYRVRGKQTGRVSHILQLITALPSTAK